MKEIHESNPALSGVRALVGRHLQHLSKQVTEEEYRLHVLEMHFAELSERRDDIDDMWKHLSEEHEYHQFEQSLHKILQQSADIVATQQKMNEITTSLKQLRYERSVLHDIEKSLGEMRSDEGFDADDDHEKAPTSSRQAFKMIEEERMRIARDMHDGPAQSLANLVLQAEILERLMKNDPDQVTAELNDFKAGVRQVLDETRRLIFDLRPMTLDDLGLVPTLRKFTKEFQDHAKINTTLRVMGEEGRLPGSFEQSLFRIVQEALNNARKHSQASNIDITVTFEPKQVRVVVRDDGVGFDEQQLETRIDGRDHLGLTSMRERAAMEDGTVTVESRPGMGTTVKVVLKY